MLWNNRLNIITLTNKPDRLSHISENKLDRKISTENLHQIVTEGEKVRFSIYTPHHLVENGGGHICWTMTY